jgi:hypothetical protein
VNKKIHAADSIILFARGKSRTYCGRRVGEATVINKRSRVTCKRCLRWLDSQWTWRDENPNF